MTSSSDFWPKLVMASRSSSVFWTSSPTELTCARLRQLRALGQVEVLDRQVEVGRPGAGHLQLAQLEALGLVAHVGHEADQRAQRVAGRGQRIPRRDRAVGLDVDDQPVELGRLLDPGGLDLERHAADGREDRVDGDDADGLGHLVGVGGAVAPALRHRDVDRDAARLVERRQVEVLVRDLDVGRELDVLGRDVGGCARRGAVTGSSLWLTSTMSLRLRMMSVTSSTTPGMVSNSCRASSKRTCVMAAPGIDDSRVRRSELPSVWPKPGSSGPRANRWRLFSSSAIGSTVGRCMTSIGGSS